MSVKTTVIGVYPKPDYLDIPVWYKEGQGQMDCDRYENFIKSLTDKHKADLDEKLAKAEKEVIEAQCNLGLDIITDGEVYRDVYIFHFLRHLDGIDFNNPEKTRYRNGACTATLPVISGKVENKTDKLGFMAKIWKSCQALSSVPVKVTLPGPMTITNTSVRRYYDTNREQCLALAECLKAELREIVGAGCKYIQIDEPLFARLPQEAKDFGISIMSDILSVIPSDVHSTVHICCGYSDELDQVGYVKANPQAYTELAEELDNMGASAISIEAAFCDLDFSVLQKFNTTGIVLGLVAVCKSRVESVEEIEGRLMEALKYIPRSRLMAAPDCGLSLLPTDIMNQKLKNLVTAVRNCNKAADNP